MLVLVVKAGPSTQFEVVPVNAKLYSVPLYGGVVDPFKVVRPVLVPLATP